MASTAEIYEPDFLMAEAMLGISCEEFWSSPAGRFVRGRAEGEVRDLLKELVTAPAEDLKRNRDIRIEINVRQRVLQYLDDAINNGELARYQLEENGD